MIPPSTTFVFTNLIASEDIFLVREPLELGNDENVEVLFKISIGSYWTLPTFKKSHTLNLNREAKRIMDRKTLKGKILAN